MESGTAKVSRASIGICTMATASSHINDGVSSSAQRPSSSFYQSCSHMTGLSRIQIDPSKSKLSAQMFSSASPLSQILQHENFIHKDVMQMIQTF